ncbi:hypothetical protein [Geothrix sp. PMB-07]|uniref:hypothetical protein n=1 Tax=Geothrix sp. PMB-07 TaxID=3068640 RepID=UPI002742244D|nr:hypothetical protein [Geothrix sp. PMB-07]WLT32891.1 hypothetical protein Q9293_06040 [Geothrix sp. PMB-07]
MALCAGTPAFIALLLLTRVVPPGSQAPEGGAQQVGYLFTGLVFLSGAWVWSRRGRVLRGFKSVAEAQRPSLILRESLLYAAAFEASSVWGLIYWTLVGGQAARHVWGFLLLTPMLFLALVPRFGHWAKRLEA